MKDPRAGGRGGVFVAMGEVVDVEGGGGGSQGVERAKEKQKGGSDFYVE